MKKDYSIDEMKKIMGKDMEVPKSVDEGMKKAYEQLGIQTTRRHNRKYKLWTGLAAAAVLTAGLSITAFAVTKYLNVTRSEEGDTLQYQIEVDTKQKEAHQIKVEPTYMPEGMNIRKKVHMAESGIIKRPTVGFPSYRIMRQSFTRCPEWMKILFGNSVRKAG